MNRKEIHPCILTILLVLSIVILPMQGVEADSTITPPPTDDSFVSISSQYANYGSSMFFSVRALYNTEYAYLKFPLSDLPTPARSIYITSAKIWLRTQYLDGATTVDAKFVSDDSWTESTITWNNKPPLGSLSSSTTVTSLNTWYSWDVSSQARAENTGDRILSIGMSTTGNGAQFYSTEYGSYSPYLEVTYSQRTYWEAPLPDGPALLNQTHVTYKQSTYTEASLSANVHTIDYDPVYNQYACNIAVIAAANSRHQMGYSTDYRSYLLSDPPYTLSLPYDDAGAWVGTGDTWINYYGAWYRNVFITSNGFISLDPHAYNGGPWISYIPKAVPSADDANLLIAPFWRNLNPAKGGTIKYGFVNYMGWYGFAVKWINIKNFANSNKQTFGVFLSGPDTRGVSHLAFVYSSITNDVSTKIGIEDQSGKRGVPISSVSSGQSIDFIPNFPDNNIGIRNLKISASKLTDDGTNDNKARIDISGLNQSVPGGINVELIDTSEGKYNEDPVLGAADVALGALGLAWEKASKFLGVVGFALSTVQLAMELSRTPESTMDEAEESEQTAYVSNVAKDENVSSWQPHDAAVFVLFRWILKDPSVNHRLVINLQVDCNYAEYGNPLITDNIELKLTPPSSARWYGRTNPDAHYYNSYQISNEYGTGYHIDTLDSTDYGYQILGWNKLTSDKSEDYKVGADGKIRVGGYFRQSDTFDAYLQPGKRLMNIYVMYSKNLNKIVKTVQVLDYTDGTDWKYKGMIIDGLSAGESVKVGIGRPDAWYDDWQLTAEWAGVEVGQGAGSAPLKPPDPPWGETVVQRNVFYTYHTRTADPDGDRIRYEFEFSGPIPTVSFITGWYSSNEIGDFVVKWGDWEPLGTYYVRTRAQDYYGVWGDWSQPLTVTLVETIPSLRFSLREHGTCLYNPSWTPDIRFLKPSSSVLRIDSYQSGTSSMGCGWAFIVVPRDWVNGKYVRFSWSGYFSYTQPRVLGGAYIYDGEYDCTNDLDFPDGQGIPVKGAGLLQTLAQKNTYGYWGPETIDVPVNVAAGTQSKCTIFFLTGDAWIQQTLYFDIDWFEINQGAGGVGNLAVENFDASVIMERIGTYKDYGYISSGYVP